ncbi:hypothetical protein ACVNP1_10045 [Staphylococcus aureus]
MFSKYSYICEKYEDTIAIEFEVLLLNIKKAKSIAFRDVKNHFVRNENSYCRYFFGYAGRANEEMLMRMKPLIESICHKDPLLNDVLRVTAERNWSKCE